MILPMTNERAEAAAQAWSGQAGGKLLPQLTANELAAIVNEAVREARTRSPECAMASADLVAVLRRRIAWIRQPALAEFRVKSVAQEIAADLAQAITALEGRVGSGAIECQKKAITP